MKKQDKLFVALCAGTIAFALAFVVPVVTQQSVAWYYPVEHRWAFSVRPAGVAMDFYFRTAQAAVAWAVGFLAGFVIASRLPALRPRWVGLFTAWAVTATVGVMGFYAWSLAHRGPEPAPIPAWYQPR